MTAITCMGHATRTYFGALREITGLYFRQMARLVGLWILYP